MTTKLLEPPKRDEPTPNKDYSIFDVPVELIVVKHPYARRFAVGWSWRVIKCPFCRKLHWHGAGNILEGPEPLHLGLRVPHCLNSPNGDYRLVDLNPIRTIELKRKALREAQKTAAAGNTTAKKIIAKAQEELKIRAERLAAYEAKSLGEEA